LPSQASAVATAEAANRPVALAVEAVERSFGSVWALAGIDLSVHEGELLTILGPSGSGKTTLLKAIAGFESLDRGRICLGGRDITDLAPARREIGMVFQNYALFPHMTAFENVAFPLRMRRKTRDRLAQQVHSVLDQVAMGELAQRYPVQLSGGQQQRIALARAIVFNPRLLLLDEPFGALDRKLRQSMQLEVRHLQRRLGLTTILITHDQEEALIMSDRIAVMHDGQLRQIGAPQEIYARPRDLFVADFVGESNLIDGRIDSIYRGGARIIRPGGQTIIAALDSDLALGEEVTVLLRPEMPRPIGDTGVLENEFHGRVVEAIYLGDSIKYRLQAQDSSQLLVRWAMSAAAGSLPLGSEIAVGWSAAEGHVLRRPAATTLPRRAPGVGGK
jgi:putative spermidine/putrescine transport system ATP-binding protein